MTPTKGSSSSTAAALTWQGAPATFEINSDTTMTRRRRGTQHFASTTMAEGVFSSKAGKALPAAPPPPSSQPKVDTKPASDVLAGAVARAASQGTIHPIDTLKVGAKGCGQPCWLLPGHCWMVLRGVLPGVLLGSFSSEQACSAVACAGNPVQRDHWAPSTTPARCWAAGLVEA